MTADRSGAHYRGRRVRPKDVRVSRERESARASTYVCARGSGRRDRRLLNGPTGESILFAGVVGRRLQLGDGTKSERGQRIKGNNACATTRGGARARVYDNRRMEIYLFLRVRVETSVRETSTRYTVVRTRVSHVRLRTRITRTTYTHSDTVMRCRNTYLLRLLLNCFVVVITNRIGACDDDVITGTEVKYSTAAHNALNNGKRRASRETHG